MTATRDPDPRWRHMPPAERDLDEIAVERAVMGDPPAQLTRAERAEAVRRLDRYGYTTQQIAEHIGYSQREVLRTRARNAGKQPAQHGASTYENWGCRCPTCTDASNAKSREGHARRRRMALYQRLILERYGPAQQTAQERLGAA